MKSDEQAADHGSAWQGGGAREIFSGEDKRFTRIGCKPAGGREPRSSARSIAMARTRAASATAPQARPRSSFG
jgi:hypothetical protein